VEKTEEDEGRVNSVSFSRYWCRGGKEELDGGGGRGGASDEPEGRDLLLMSFPVSSRGPEGRGKEKNNSGR